MVVEDDEKQTNLLRRVLPMTLHCAFVAVPVGRLEVGSSANA